MNGQAFQTLLDRRQALRVQHEAYCAEINDSRLSESSSEARIRDQVYTELEAVQGQIDAEIAAERTAELEGA